VLACEATAPRPVTDWSISGAVRPVGDFSGATGRHRRDLENKLAATTDASLHAVIRRIPVDQGVGLHCTTRTGPLSFTFGHTAIDKWSD